MGEGERLIPGERREIGRGGEVDTGREAGDWERGRG